MKFSATQLVKFVELFKDNENITNQSLLDLLAKLNIVWDGMIDITNALGIRIDNNPKLIVNDPTYGSYRLYEDGSTQGRVIFSSVVRSSALALVNATPKTITSIPIPANSKWRIVTMGGVSTAGATIPTRIALGISKTTNALPAANTQNVPTNGEVFTVDFIPAVGGNEADIQAEEIYENTTSSPVTLFMVMQLNFTVAGASGYGSIFAESIT